MSLFSWLEQNLQDPEFVKALYGFRLRTAKRGRPKPTRTDSVRAQREWFLGLWAGVKSPEELARLRLLLESDE